MEEKVREIRFPVKGVPGPDQVAGNGGHGDEDRQSGRHDGDDGNERPDGAEYRPGELEEKRRFHHWISSGGAGVRFVVQLAILPLLMVATRIPMAPIAALWVTMTTVVP